MKPMISIVITAYNYRHYIQECLDSCYNQTYRPIEIIVVDDGSTDGTKHMVSCPGCIIIHHKKNAGYAVAKNTGILAAKGEFIVMLDADDKLTPDSITLRMGEFEKNPELDLVHGIALRWYGRNGTRGYNKKTYCHAQGRMYRRSIYNRYGLYYEPLRSMADKEMVYRLGVHPDSPLPKLIKEKKIKEVVAWYRKHDKQMHKVRRNKPKYNAEIKSIFKRRIKQLKREGITQENTRFD
jgi:glycosyltransferase involved in cell wall biosynthesis